MDQDHHHAHQHGGQDRGQHDEGHLGPADLPLEAAPGHAVAGGVEPVDAGGEGAVVLTEVAGHLGQDALVIHRGSRAG
ncbi:hypothetical protein FDA94_37610 [Herbidospora galbida]|uniref:Uncharacterized protein n=1 Tax=Herbidospora galbida TaxID=2575442 RepID=A0A4U3LT65_9ACTN|nr:hypothetical protein [Herbidospora galbida]TKK78659.1 hypothetical protein FDA94_37610 [Herbidospora galbida]